jgi:glycerophosphoryl diester phosphodiesterase
MGLAATMKIRTRAAALLLASVLAVPRLAAVEIIAHRGASADAPENSLSAMKLAWEQKADAVELDLWLSSDGKLIVFHDANTKRFENKPRGISSLTLAEARKLDVGAWKDPKFKGERIPTLISILETIPKGKRAVLEIKCGPEILPELSREIRKSGRPPEELVIISFNHDALKRSKGMFPRIEHFLLSDYKKGKAGKVPELQPLIERCKAAGFAGLGLQYHWPIDARFTAQVKSSGLKLLVWTVDDAIVARRLRDAGVDAITTNKPRLLREELGLK